MTAALQALHSSLQELGTRELVLTSAAAVAAELRGVHVPDRLAVHALGYWRSCGTLSVLDMLVPERSTGCMWGGWAVEREAEALL